MKTKKIPSVREIRRQNPFKNKYDPFLHPIGYLAPYVVKLLLYTPVTANQVSLLSLLLYILTAFLIAVNKYIILALILLQVFILLDGVDGRLARMKQQKTFLGLYLECTFHETAAPLLFFALGSYLFRTLNNPVYLYFGGIIVVAQLAINSFGTSKQRIMYCHIRKLGKVPPSLIGGSSILRETKSPFLRKLRLIINLFPNIDVLSYAFILGYIFGFLKYVLMFYFVYFCFLALFKVIIELIIAFKPYGLK